METFKPEMETSPDHLRPRCDPLEKKRTAMCNNKAILSTHHYFWFTKAGGSDTRYYPYAYVNGCSVPAGQPATKGPHLLSEGYYSCCARLVKNMRRDNVHQRHTRTSSFHIAITAAY